MRTRPLSLWIVVTGVLAALGLAACSDIVQDTLFNPTPLALAEADLPNCSRVINCCARMGQSPYSAVVPESVQTTCTDTLGTAAGTVIDEYQREEALIDQQTSITEERRTELRGELVMQWQTRVEPGCRCFLEETVGVLPEITRPMDCESNTGVGGLGAGATCDEGINAVVDTATNGI